MKSHYAYDEWEIIEEGFHPELNRESESIFSIGNGYMGQRANFEEQYSGNSLRGSYIAGIYYPDKTRVGWWKNGYPEYFAKVPNAPNWIGIDIALNGRSIDLFKNHPLSFRRILNMREGFLERFFKIRTDPGTSVEFNSRRFLSMAQPDAGIIKYTIRSVDFEGSCDIQLFLDSDVRNEDTNYGEKFWEEADRQAGEGWGVIVARTLKTGFEVAFCMRYEILFNSVKTHIRAATEEKTDYVSNNISLKLRPGDECTIIKYVSVLSSMNIPKENLREDVKASSLKLKNSGYEKLFHDHRNEWERIWSASDVVITGDIAAQQAIRFNIFHLNQTYTGKDPRLNIGPKGFTGEKYGGSTYWDTEAFCLPFFLKTAGREVAKNLLLYRYRHLPKSIENAEKLGFVKGAALYPMVTMNGEECHNEWEITFEEIHRNGAIAFAIHNYIRHTGDTGYMEEYGLEVLIALSRFWSQRISWSEHTKQHVILGVTGPNEYENNVNNNWYTNTLAKWTIEYTIANLENLAVENPARFKEIVRITGLDHDAETSAWEEKISDLRFTYYKPAEVFLQQDGFLDKELVAASAIPPSERPINQHWSWDRILRSCFIKQADVLQGFYFFENDYDTETIRKHFDFYEPMTVHESSLSACIHSILASRIGNREKAYELYLRTARLDLDDYNHEVGEGLHITSMAGTWLAVVEGFGGMRIHGESVLFRPSIPAQWKSCSFHARFRGVLFRVSVTTEEVVIDNLSDTRLKVIIYDRNFEIPAMKSLITGYQNSE